MSIFSSISDVEDYKHYRGWNYIIEQLSTNLLFNSNGVKLDTFADDCLWRRDKLHLTEDWVGVIHSVALNLSTVDGSIDEFLNHEWFLNSKQNCRGLITLCKHTADYLKTKINLPVSFVYHPKNAGNTFNIEKYFANPTLNHTGIHARNFSLFAKLSTTVPKIINIDGARPYLFEGLNRCFVSNNVTVQDKETVSIHTSYRADDDYISKLCESIGFVHFYDVAASNTVLEHIMSHTPLIVNKHPAIVEYLGEEYPMYYEDVCDDLDRYLSSRDFVASVSTYLKERSSLCMFKIENFISFFKDYKLKDKPQSTIPVYCINLKRALERRVYIEDEWVEKRGIEINFFDAYDRSDYTEADLPSPYRENLSTLTTKDKSEIWEGVTGMWQPNLGEVCCVMSHCELLNKLIKSNIPEAIILEDDAAPLFDTAKEFFDYIDLCKKEEQRPDILLLHKPEEWAKQDWFHIKRELEFCVILSKPTPCTQAIYYTRQGMIDVYEAALKLKGPMDYCTAYGIVQKGSLGIVKKPLVHHPIMTTYIGGRRDLVADEDFTRAIDEDFDSDFYYKANSDLADYYIERTDLSLEQRLFHHYRTAGRAEGRQKNKRTDLTIVTALLAGDVNIDKTAASLLPFLANNEVKWLIKYSESHISKDLEHLNTLPNTKIIHKSDFNLYDALNQALDYIETTYFLVLGSGDTLAEDATVHISTAMHNTSNADGYFFGVYLAAEDHYMLPNIARVYHPYPWPVCHQGVVMRVDNVLRINKFNAAYNIAADYDLMCRYVNTFDNIVCSQSIVSTYLGGGLSEQRELEGLIEQNLSRYRNFGARCETTCSIMIDQLMDYRSQIAVNNIKLNKVHTAITDCYKVYIPRFKKSLYKTHPDLEVKYLKLDAKRSRNIPEWLNAMKQRLELIYECLCDNSDEDEIFMFCNLDVQFSAPFRSYIETLLVANDIVLQNNYLSHNTGFFACRKTQNIKELFKAAVALSKYRWCDDRIILNEVIETSPSIKAYILPTELFTIGLHEKEKGTLL